MISLRAQNVNVAIFGMAIVSHGVNLLCRRLDDLHNEALLLGCSRRRLVRRFILRSLATENGSLGKGG